MQRGLVGRRFGKHLRARNPRKGIVGQEDHSTVMHTGIEISTVTDVQGAKNDPVGDEKGEEAQEANTIYQHVETGMNAATLPQAIGIDVGEGPDDGKHELHKSVLIPLLD